MRRRDEGDNICTLWSPTPALVQRDSQSLPKKLVRYQLRPDRRIRVSTDEKVSDTLFCTCNFLFYQLFFFLSTLKIQKKIQIVFLVFFCFGFFWYTADKICVLVRLRLSWKSCRIRFVESYLLVFTVKHFWWSVQVKNNHGLGIESFAMLCLRYLPWTFGVSCSNRMQIKNFSRGIDVWKVEKNFFLCIVVQMFLRKMFAC